MTAKIRVLFVSGTPVAYLPIDDDAEYKEVHEELTEKGKYRDFFEVTRCLSASRHELIEAVARESPHIVHFACHGNADGLIFRDDSGESDFVNGEDLQALLDEAGDLRVVVLSACHSSELAEALSRARGITTIGVSDILVDTHAREFSESFYSALARGKPVAQAHSNGVLAIPNGAHPEPRVDLFGPGSFKVSPKRVARTKILDTRHTILPVVLAMVLVTLQAVISLYVPSDSEPCGQEESVRRGSARHEVPQRTEPDHLTTTNLVRSK